MSCYIMRARTSEGQWYTYDISDIPVQFSDDEFCLMNKPGSPRLKLDTMRRGERETGLFEGDVILMDGLVWAICYDRGFYAINAEYLVRYLYQLTDFSVVGSCETMEPPVTVSLRRKHIYKYRDTVFRTEEIAGGYGGKIHSAKLNRNKTKLPRKFRGSFFYEQTYCIALYLSTI